MKLPKGQVLMHAGRPYDPAKAHDYYIRTRQLKGRKPGGGNAPGGGHAPPRAADNQQQKVAAAEQVARLRSKLGQLQTELKKRMAEARKADAKAKKPPTAAEKSKQARDAKKYRKKNAQQLKNKAKQASAKSGGGASGPKASASKGGGSVDELKQTIKQVQTSLAAAVARQRALG